MKTLGQQVQDFLDEKGLSTAKLAELIGGTVRRQHIEQLLANPTRLPRYVKKLAQVMGKSVDELMGVMPAGNEPAPLPEWSYEARKLARWLDKIKDERDHTAAYAAAIAPILRVVNGLPPLPTHTPDGRVTEETPREPPPSCQRLRESAEDPILVLARNDRAGAHPTHPCRSFGERPVDRQRPMHAEDQSRNIRCFDHQVRPKVWHRCIS